MAAPQGIGFAAKPIHDLTIDTENARNSADAALWRHAQDEGRLVVDLPTDRIVLDHVMRARMVVDNTELDELKASIRAHGLRLPIEVVPLAAGLFGLISGWRRVTAVQQLHAETGDFVTIKAFVRKADQAGAIYTAMVEENELRAQLTPYERGRIAVMSAREGAFTDTEAAIETIFATASKAKRSKIRSFAFVHEELGDMLQFPTDLSERNGLRLAYALREGFAVHLRTALRGSRLSGPTYEWTLLEPIVAAAEAVERLGDKAAIHRGGRPRSQFERPSGRREPLANGISMERVLHEDGYSIRLRGAVVDTEMIDLLMDDLRRRLSPMVSFTKG